MKDFMIKYALFPIVVLFLCGLYCAFSGYMTAFAWLFSIAGVIALVAEVIDEDLRKIWLQMIAAPFALIFFLGQGVRNLFRPAMW